MSQKWKQDHGGDDLGVKAFTIQMWRLESEFHTQEVRDRGVPRARWLAIFIILLGSGFDGETLPKLMRWKNNWKWFLISTLCLCRHMHTHPDTSVHTHVKRADIHKWKGKKQEWVNKRVEGDEERKEMEGGGGAGEMAQKIHS